jgi:hypothetical protein
MTSALGLKWVGIDLHVHTPASSDYRGRRDEDEYIRIARQAKEFHDSRRPKGHDSPESTPIGCLAFTDHNSINGFETYRDLVSKKSAFADNVRALDPGNALLKRLEPDVAALKSIRVLMGVEVNCSPGIHIILIFRENVDPERVRSFLSESFGRPYTEIEGQTEPMTKCTIETMLDRAQVVFNDEILVVAPHIDSDCGVLEGLRDHGQARISVLNHPALAALSFIKEETREHLKRLAADPSYSRLGDLAFIQASDFQ